MQSIINLQSVVRRSNKYGITEKKKAELDALTSDVLDAQLNVEQYQAMVDSLTDKTMKFQQFLTDADGERAKALNNRNMVDTLVRSVSDLLSNSDTSFEEAGNSDVKTTLLAKQMKTLIDKLIYSADLITKLATLVVRRKAKNPLISDELISIVSGLGKDANNAVAVTLVALTSVFTAQASIKESASASTLEYEQAVVFYGLLTGKNIEEDADKDDHKLTHTSLQANLHLAYSTAKQNYEQIHHASNMSTRQLSHAQAMLNKAQVKLKSLQSGLSAGNAAALAS